MISISSIFKDVLLKEDNITVPGLGTFEATYQPAQLDEKTGVIYPPTKLVKLNPDKTNDTNDTLLKYVVEAYKVSNVDAKEAIDRFVKDVKEKVESKSIVTLEDVGTLQLGEGGAIVLKAMPSKLSIDNYGMDTVEVEPVQASERVAAPVAAAATSRGKIVKSDAPRAAAATTKVSTTKVTTTKTTTTKTEKEKKEKSKFPWWLVCLLAFVAVLAVLFFIYKDTVMGWFGNDKPVADTKTEQPANDQTKPGNANDGKTTSLDNPAESERPTIDSDLEILAQAGFSNVSPQNLGSKYKKYYLIGGSYRDPQRANERKRAIGGKEILNVDGSDLFRVVLAGSDSAKEIVDEYNKALKRGVKPADIWLLKNSK